MFETVDIDTLMKLLTLRTKRDLKAFARDAVIQSTDLAALMFTCETGEMPWRIRSTFMSVCLSIYT
jgi:hypothetical protein